MDRFTHPLKRLGRHALLGTLLLALSGCWGGFFDVEDADEPVAVELQDAAPVLRNPKTGFARLGALKGASIEILDLHSDSPIFTTTTDAEGRFRIDLGDHPLDALYRVQVRGGTDVNFDDKGTSNQAPVTNRGTLSAIASGAQIVERGVSVTVLSDLLARAVGDAIQWSPKELVMRELDEAASHLLAHDVEGDGKVDYRDVLAFDPQQERHRGWLKFDWELLFLKNSVGLSVMDMLHANHPAYGDELLALLGDSIDISLPDAEHAPLASLNFGVDGHGTLTTAVVPVPVEPGRSRYATAVDRSTSEVIAVRAQPAAGSRLLGWEGCTVDPTDPQLCRVTPDATKSVVAIFQDPEKAFNNTTVLHLSSAANPVGFVLHETDAVITAVSSDAIVPRLDAALARVAADPGHRFFVGADRAALSTVRITGVRSRTEVDGVVRYVTTYASAKVTDALESVSVYAPPAPISVDTIASISVAQADGTLGNKLEPFNEANSDFVAGPNPVDHSVDMALCGTSKTQHRLSDGNVACISPANLPVQTGHGLLHACSAQEVLVETLDGEDFCVPPADIHNRAEEASVRGAAGNRPLSFGSSRQGIMSIQALQQPVQTTAAPRAFKRGEVVWLVGHGKAIYLTHKVFMVDRPDGKGVRMITADGVITSVDEGSRAPMAFQSCMRSASAPECRFFDARQAAMARGDSDHRTIQSAGTPQATLIPEITLVGTPAQYPWITVSFTINVDLTGEASASFNYGVLWYAFSSRGKIEIEPVFKTTVKADGLARFTRPAGSTDPSVREERDPAMVLKSGEPVFEKELFSLDFLQKIPGVNTVSPVLESALRFSIGVDATGQARIEIETSYKQVVAWDVQSEFTYYVFKSNHNLQSFKVAARGYPGMKMTMDVNGSIGMFAKASVSMGPRYIMPDLAKLQARYYLYKLEAMGQLLMSYQTDPEKVADQHGQNFCWAGGISMTLKRGFDVTATIDMRPQGFLGDILSHVALPRWDWTLYNWDGVILNVGAKRGSVTQDTVFGADTSVLGVSSGGSGAVMGLGTSLDCPAPSPATMPAERNFGPNNFKLLAGHSLYTKTHEYTMSLDGEFSIYQWNGTRGARIWTSSTAGKARVGGYNELVMEQPQHLVIKDIVGNKLWQTGVYGTGGTRVRLAPEGALQIWTKNTMLWSTQIGTVQAGALPVSAVYTPGNFELSFGEAVAVVNRTLFLDMNGRLWFQRMQDNRYHSSVWNNGVSTGFGTKLVFQADGNLVETDWLGNVVWQSGTANLGAAKLVVQGNGRVSIQKADGAVLWGTSS